MNRHLTREQYRKEYEQWEARAESGACTWRFAAAQIALLSMEYGAWRQFCQDQTKDEPDCAAR